MWNATKYDLPENLSVPGAAMLFLVWQDPSDRALAGWTPYPGLHPDGMNVETLTRWLHDQVQQTFSEEHDAAVLNRVD